MKLDTLLEYEVEVYLFMKPVSYPIFFWYLIYLMIKYRVIKVKGKEIPFSPVFKEAL